MIPKRSCGLRGDEVFGRRITITYFRDQTGRNPSANGATPRQKSEAKARELERLQAELGVVCYAAPGQAREAQDRRLSTDESAAPGRSCSSAGRSAWARRRKHGRDARRTARTGLRSAPSQSSVGPGDDRARQRPPEARPAGAAVELGRRAEQRQRATRADEYAPAMLLEQRAGEWRARSRLPSGSHNAAARAVGATGPASAPAESARRRWSGGPSR